MEHDSSTTSDIATGDAPTSNSDAVGGLPGNARSGYPEMASTEVVRAKVDLATLRRLIKIGGYVRATLGVFLLVAPGLASMWLGPDARRPAVKALVRIAAIRDLILGAGSIVAANEGTHLRRWVEFTMIADGVDAIASAAAIRHTPPLRGAVMTATAAGAAAGGALILSQLPEEVPSTA